MLLNLNYDIQLYLLKHIVALDEETAKRDPNYYHDAVEFYQPRLTFWAKKGSIFSLSYVSRAVRDLVFPILFQQLDIDLHNLNLVDDQEYGLHTLYRCKKSAAFVRQLNLVHCIPDDPAWEPNHRFVVMVLRLLPALRIMTVNIDMPLEPALLYSIQAHPTLISARFLETIYLGLEDGSGPRPGTQHLAPLNKIMFSAPTMLRGDNGSNVQREWHHLCSWIELGIQISKLVLHDCDVGLVSGLVPLTIGGLTRLQLEYTNPFENPTQWAEFVERHPLLRDIEIHRRRSGGAEVCRRMNAIPWLHQGMDKHMSIRVLEFHLRRKSDSSFICHGLVVELIGTCDHRCTQAALTIHSLGTQYPALSRLTVKIYDPLIMDDIHAQESFVQDALAQEFTKLEFLMILGLDSSEPGKSLEMYERFFSSLATFHAKALPRLHKAILASNPRRERGVVYFAMIGREENAAKLSKVRI